MSRFNNTYYFWHNGHRVAIGPYPNKYEAATEFRNLYGYWPDLESVSLVAS